MQFVSGVSEEIPRITSCPTGIVLLAVGDVIFSHFLGRSGIRRVLDLSCDYYGISEYTKKQTAIYEKRAK
jgi:hypothetical protein